MFKRHGQAQGGRAGAGQHAAHRPLGPGTGKPNDYVAAHAATQPLPGSPQGTPKRLKIQPFCIHPDSPMPAYPASAPIGVFDSGIGGLSVLAALRAALPHERFIYLADSGHAPYGEKGDALVTQRSLAIGLWLQQHGIKALVVACNTATAAAIEALRAALPDLPVVGVEPALKPAAQATRTGCVGVLATRGTVSSARFARLRAEHQGPVRFAVQACDGLAQAIEQATAEPPAANAAQADIQTLCQRYLAALGRLGEQPGDIDTLVLGCTHYVFAAPVLRALAGPQVRLIDTGAAVARHTQRLLQARQALAQAGTAQPGIGLYSTGDPQALQAAARRWLGLADCPAQHIYL